MQDRDELAKYICDRIETTPIRCGRSVERVGDHAHRLHRAVPRQHAMAHRDPAHRRHRVRAPSTSWLRRTPSPNSRSIVDALADEYEFRARKDDKGDSHRDAALALPKAPYALPAST